jgi:hypothetical protein
MKIPTQAEIEDKLRGEDLNTHGSICGVQSKDPPSQPR